MILSQTPKLTLQEQFVHLTGWKDFKHKKWIFCPNITHEFFDFPEDVQYIRFVAHSHPGKDRVKLEFDLDIQLDSQLAWTDDKGRAHISYVLLADGEKVFFHVKAENVVEWLLRKHKKIYVECLYED